MISMMPEPQMPVTPIAAIDVGKARLVRPEIAADHFEARLQRFAIDAHALDGAGRGALAAGNLRALESRAGRRGAGDEAILIAEYEFGIGADIDQQSEFIAQIRPFGEHDGGGVGADMAGNAGQAIDESAGRDIEAEFARPRFEGAVQRQRERRAAEFGRIEAEEQMVHDRIADHGDFENIGPRHARLFDDLANQRIDGAAHAARQFSLAARIHHDIGDPAHQVVAEADLRVHQAGGGEHFAA